MKRFISIALTVIIAASVFSAAIPAGAVSDDYYENGFYFKLGEDNNATVTGTDLDDVFLYIPSDLENGYQVTAIGDGAFKGNLKMESVSCESDLESIGEYAFEDCSHLAKASFGGQVGSIGKGAFSMCSSLNEVNLSKNVSSIGDGAFFFDEKLTAFGFPKNLESVGEYAFAFSGVTNVIMNNKIKTIPERLFYGCKSLRNIALPKDLETVGDYAFTKCEALDIDSFPSTLNRIGKYAFSKCGFSSIDYNGAIIGEGAFSKNNDTIEELRFSDNLKKVGKLAFSETSVTNVELPDNVTLENGAFAAVSTDKYSLKETNSKYICDDGVVYTKDKKTLVYYPQDKGSADASDDEAGYTYTIANKTEAVAPCAFYGSNYVSEVKMPDSLKTIGDYAFYQSSLKTITVPDSVKKLGEYSFAKISGIKSIDLGSVEEIGDMAFLACAEEPVTVKIPDTLKAFNPNAFISSGIKFDADEAYKAVDGVLYSADGKTLLCYPKSDDTEFKIPDGVEEIAPRAFALNNTALELSIPKSLKTIGKEALEYFISYEEEYEDLKFKDGMYLIGNVSAEVKDYASKHNIGVFTEKPSQNIESVTLKGKETADFTIKGADKSDVVYTSNNDRIASVSESGKITGLKKGTTYVTAAVGTSYFKVKVNVTSDSGVKYTGFDDGGYYRITPKTYDQWRKNYLKNNQYIVDNYNEASDEAAMGAYQSEDYFMAMDGVTYDGSNFYQKALVDYGKDFEPMISMLNHACNTELARHKNSDSLVLYSGAEPYASRLIAGENNTIKSLREKVGTTFKHPEYVSTSLSPNVANDFYSKGEGVMYIIYAEKSALDKIPAGLIAAMHSDFEYELLFAPGSEFEVVDAGVRWFENSEWKKSDDEPVSNYQRYVKLRLLGGKDTPDKRPTPSISLTKAPKNMYLKQTANLKYSFKNTYDHSVTFTSSNTKAAKISKNGKITALKKGTTTITVSNSETKTSFKLTVKKPSLNITKRTVKKGNTFKLKVKGGVGKAKFKSKSKKTASVSKKGVVKAKKKGSTTITVKTNGITLKCKVKVK